MDKATPGQWGDAAVGSQNRFVHFRENPAFFPFFLTTKNGRQ
jgi:hypothetical protein